MNEGGTPLFAVRGLVKQYGEGTAAQRALDGVDLDIEPGSFVAIMGPSGSGKSTLLHLLGGLDTPTSGEVRLHGATLSDLDDDERTRIRRDRMGFVFQAFHLVDVLTVAENVALPVTIRGGSPAPPAVARALAGIGLDQHADRLPAALSGGEQQRVAIARALFAEPDVILADEPTGNLDQAAGDAALTLLRRAVDDGHRTVVLVTHDPRAAAVADTAVLLRDGRVVDQLDLDSGVHERADRVQAWLTAASA